MTTQTSFDPAAVQIGYSLNFEQVNLILEALGKLPFERVEALYSGMRAHALAVMAESQRHTETLPAPETAPLPEEDVPNEGRPWEKGK
ncbi:MAG: hypothetical protein WC997_02195 [Porticoccaceae bacterium]